MLYDKWPCVRNTTLTNCCMGRYLFTFGTDLVLLLRGCVATSGFSALTEAFEPPWRNYLSFLNSLCRVFFFDYGCLGLEMPHSWIAFLVISRRQIFANRSISEGKLISGLGITPWFAIGWPDRFSGEPRYNL